MKSIPLFCLGLVFATPVFSATTGALLSTNVAQLAPGFAVGVEPHRIVARAESQRIWEQVKYLTNFNLPIPRVEIITNRYTELGAGICFQRPDGTWADSQARFALTLDGSVEATDIPHKVRISPDLRSIAAVKMTLPDGRLMSSTFRGLYLYDSSTEQRLLVSDITNSIGTLISSNVLVYSNCFASLKGDLVLKVTPAGLAQDVVIRESLSWVPFDEIQFDPKSTVLEAWTEFYDSPAPEKQTTTLPARNVAEGATETLSDETLKFGDVLMVHGRAYVVPASAGAPGSTNASIRLNAPAAARDSVPVGKTWLEQDNRRFLIERLRWREILPHFKRLETNSLTAAARPRGGSLGSATVPVALAGVSPANSGPGIDVKPRILFAQAPATDTPAFVLDYTTVNCSGGVCNGYRFEPNETYYVSAPIIITGEAVFFGGAVIKLADTTTFAGISLTGTAKFETGPGRMVFITGKDDDSVGAEIAGSTHTISPNKYGYPALVFGDSVPLTDIDYIRISHAAVAIEFQNVGPNRIRHSQFVSA
jgi:hypothetical protein